jgi:Ring finger domain
MKDEEDDVLCRTTSSTVCAICHRGYGVNEALCWSQDPCCGHVFHRPCLEDWIAEGNDVCPLCAARGEDRIHPESNNNHDPITSLNQNCKETHCHTVGDGTTWPLEHATRVVPSISELGMNANETTLDVQQIRSTEKRRAEVNGSGCRGHSVVSNTSPSWTRDIPLSPLVASHNNQDTPFEASEEDLWDFPSGNIVQGGCSDEENSQALSIGSWSATSDVICTSQSDKTKTVSRNAAAVHAVLPIPISKTRRDSVKRPSHVKHSVGDIESSLAEWDSIIDTFARMNKLGLSPRGVNRIASSQSASTTRSDAASPSTSLAESNS